MNKTEMKAIFDAHMQRTMRDCPGFSKDRLQSIADEWHRQNGLDVGTFAVPKAEKPVQKTYPQKPAAKPKPATKKVPAKAPAKKAPVKKGGKGK